MTEFKAGDRVRLKERYFQYDVGTEGTVTFIRDDVLLSVDSLPGGGIYADRFELVESHKDSPKGGDVVRVVLEGKVTYVEAGFGFDIAGENFIEPANGHVKSIEIIKPAKPSASDLPVGSVIRDPKGIVYVKLRNGWLDTSRGVCLYAGRPGLDSSRGRGVEWLSPTCP